MDALGNMLGEEYVAVVALAFLQAGCGNAECRKELLTVSRELGVTRDINSNGVRCEVDENDENLETDGHSGSSQPVWLRDQRPIVLLQGPGELLQTLWVPWKSHRASLVPGELLF